METIKEIINCADELARFAIASLFCAVLGVAFLGILFALIPVGLISVCFGIFKRGNDEYKKYKGN